MIELPANDEIVTIDGKQYSRLMAEEMARDIALAHTIRPGVWAITDNTSLIVGNVAMLSFCVPIKHGYLVDAEQVPSELADLVGRYGDNPDFSNQPSFRYLKLPNEGLKRHMDLLRPAHESLVRMYADGFHKRSRLWESHNFDLARNLSEIANCEIPLPEYAEELIKLREGDPEMSEVSEETALSGFDPALLKHIADDIVTAHSINPRSWSLYLAQGEVLTLAVSHLAVIRLVGNDNGFWLKGNLEDSRFQSLHGASLKLRKFDPSGGFKVSGMNPEECLDRIQEYSSEHTESVANLASGVQTKSHWHKLHQPHVLAELARLVNAELSPPEYPPNDEAAKFTIDHIGGRRYWKVSAGTQDKYWDDMLRLGRIHHENWAAEPVHLDQLPTEYDSFVHAITQHGGIAKPAADHCWRIMHEMKPGDLAVALERNRSLGWAEIAGDYEYVDDNGLPQHQRSAAWTELPPYQISNMSKGLKDDLWGFGPRELAPPHFAEAIGATLTGYEPGEEEPTRLGSTEPIDPLSSVRDQFAATGLYYSEARIATFYTSLQTKGFVVLSGISGTGKSKIATGFVEMLPGPGARVALPPDMVGLIPITVKPYMRTYKRVVLPTRQVDLLPPIDIGSQIEIEIVLDGVRGDGRIEHRAHPGGSSITVLYFRGEIGKAVADLDVETKLYLRPTLRDDGDSIQQVDLLRTEDLIIPVSDDADKSGAKNHLFLSVRADWRDSTSLLGYYNPLTQTYEWTEFLRFIIRARDNFLSDNPIAWFVILDEMNLAHVEYYFADLLSVLESGRDEQGLTKEPLLLAYPDTLDDEVPPPKLHLPPNLYIIGTVNMDETTHAFSPKVLDRAFTIELTDVDFLHYQIADTSTAARLPDERKEALFREFARLDPQTDRFRFARISKDEIAEIDAAQPEIRQFLHTLNTLLRQNRFHFGYRIFDEICQYLYNNRESGMMPFEAAFDQAVFMKVLPKFNGSKARLRYPLLALLTWALDPEVATETRVKEVSERFVSYLDGTSARDELYGREPEFGVVAERVVQMLVTLENDGFVSFG